MECRKIDPLSISSLHRVLLVEFSREEVQRDHHNSIYSPKAGHIVPADKIRNESKNFRPRLKAVLMLQGKHIKHKSN